MGLKEGFENFKGKLSQFLDKKGSQDLVEYDSGTVGYADPEYDNEEEQEEYESYSNRRKNFKINSINDGKRSQIRIIKPKNREACEEILILLKERVSVIVNKENFSDQKETKSMLDYLAGGVFALDGRLEKINNSTFIVLPKNFELLKDNAQEIDYEPAGKPW